MSKKILQINFKFNVSRLAYEKTASTMVSQFAAIEGCLWKVWLMNEDKREAGGIYLFENDASVAAFLHGPLIAGLKSHPALSDFNIKHFDVIDTLTNLTRGPI